MREPWSRVGSNPALRNRIARTSLEAATPTDASGASSSPYTDCVKSGSVAECVELGCCACDGPPRPISLTQFVSDAQTAEAHRAATTTPATTNDAELAAIVWAYAVCTGHEGCNECVLLRQTERCRNGCKTLADHALAKLIRRLTDALATIEHGGSAIGAALGIMGEHDALEASLAESRAEVAALRERLQTSLQDACDLNSSKACFDAPATITDDAVREAWKRMKSNGYNISEQMRHDGIRAADEATLTTALADRERIVT